MATSEKSEPSVVRVSDPGTLVLAVPAMIGFHPRESLVLLATGGPSGRRLGLALRIDLPPPEHLTGAATAAVSGVMLDSPVGAAVIVVGTGRVDDPPARDLVDLVVAGLEARNVDAHTVIWAESTTAGAHWACYDPCRCRGVLPDPSTSAITAASVVGGKVVYADRDELVRLVAPADADRIRRREAAMISATDDGLDGSGLALLEPVAAAAAVEGAIVDSVAGRLHLDDARVLALACALTLPAVRDAAIVTSAGPDAARSAGAEHLWAALARETPDPEAAEPAALLAVSALLRGDGALANVALDRAEQAWPGHRLTGLLRSVTEVGMRPAEFRNCLQGGVPGGADLSTATTDRQAQAPRRRTRRRSA